MPALHLERDAAPGIHRITDAHTNFYLVEDGDRVTIVDTGLPRSWSSLHSALRALGRRPFEIDAVVLTHAHFDHMGFARRAQRELNLPVFVHEAEIGAASHPKRYDHERSRIPYFRHPTFARVFAEMTWMGALLVRGASGLRTFTGGERLDVAGEPEVIFTPGHSPGHCSLLYADRGAVIAGDAFVMLDPYTGRAGPCIVAAAATADSAQALSSLEALVAARADTALTGHGPAYRGSLAGAAERARLAGPA